MLTRHVSAQLARHCDGQLPPPEAARVEAHLASCARCRAERDEMLFASAFVRELAIVTPPASVWNRIAGALDRPAPPRHLFVRGLAVAAALAVLVAASVTFWLTRPSAAPWQVARLDVATAPARMAEGEWLDTRDGTRARITVGSIGSVDVEPGTRVRLGPATGGEYRLALERGTISARISAPPRLFFVETPASTVVDLGCAYTVTVDEDGGSELHMTEGWSALEWQGRQSLVPAGAMCRTRAGSGPGTPYFEDAPLTLRQAVDAFDAGAGGREALDTILRQARVRDTLTLWHLLSRVDEAQRGLVFDRIVELAPLPAGVARDRILQLDAEALRHWREELAWTW